MLKSFWDWDDPFMTRLGWENPYARLRSAMDRIFEDFGREFAAPGTWGLGFTPAFPRMNLWESGDRYVLEAEVPGLKMADVEITCQGRELSLRGERKEPEESQEAFARRERPTGSFLRTVTLPSEIDSDKVQATMIDGVLEITVPKSEQAKPRRIEVQSGGKAQRIEGTAPQKTETVESKK